LLKRCEDFVHVAQIKRRVRRRRHLARLGTDGPADPNLPLPRPSDEKPNRDRDVVAAQLLSSAASFAVLSRRRDAAATSAELLRVLQASLVLQCIPPGKHIFPASRHIRVSR
jgi:hypothetical protein